MDFVEGERMADCFDSLSGDIQSTAVNKIATIAHTLYPITSEGCGSILGTLDDYSHRKLSHDGNRSQDSLASTFHTEMVGTSKGKVLIGSLNTPDGPEIGHKEDPVEVVPPDKF